MATIPDEIKKAIEEKYPNPEGLSDVLFDTRKINAAKRSGATFGYTLQCEAKDKEIENLRHDINGFIDRDIKLMKDLMTANTEIATLTTQKAEWVKLINAMTEEIALLKTQKADNV